MQDQHNNKNHPPLGRNFVCEKLLSKDRLKVVAGPLFIGQTFVDCPATVIGQFARSGQIRILASFVGEGMGLNRYLQECVKPWLSANVPVLPTSLEALRPVLLGALEDAVEDSNPCFVGRTTLSTWVFEAFIPRKSILRT